MEVPYDYVANQPKTATTNLEIDPSVLPTLSVKTLSELLLESQKPVVKDTLRTISKKAVTSTLGDHAGVYILGNAPVACKLEKSDKKDDKGTKTFFMHALYMDGEFKLLNKEYSDYAWVRKNELSKYIGEDLYKVVDPALLEIMA
jgi:hypothetical protein